MNLGPPELIIIVAVIVLLFGARKLPELARSLGQAKSEFEHATKRRDVESTDTTSTDTTSTDTASTDTSSTDPEQA